RSLCVMLSVFFSFVFIPSARPEIYPLSLHDALPICYISGKPFTGVVRVPKYRRALTFLGQGSLLSLSGDRKVGFLVRDVENEKTDRKSTRLNSSHLGISYAVFCLKKKKITHNNLHVT